MSASYSATLLEAAKWICNVYLSLSPLGELRTNASSQAGAHLQAIKVHSPMSRVRSWQQVLGLGAADKEVGQCLGLDGMRGW